MRGQRMKFVGNALKNGSYTIDRLVEQVLVVPPTEPIMKVRDSLGLENPIKAAVVAENDRPVGLVMSLHLDRTLSQRYGVSLYADQPVSKVMEASPLTVEYNTPVEKVASNAMSRDQTHVYDHIVVTRKGVLVGIVFRMENAGFFGGSSCGKGDSTRKRQQNA